MLQKETKEKLDVLCKTLFEKERQRAVALEKAAMVGHRIPRSKRIGNSRGPGSVIRFRLVP